MPNIEIAAMTGRKVVLNAEAIEQFRNGLRGGHLIRGDDGYEPARKIYNAMIEHQPAIIARCAGVADVIAAVNFARNNGLLLSVRGGGHNVSGNAVSDGGLMIDLSPMKSVRVDPQGKTVRAEAGVTWGEFDRETQARACVCITSQMLPGRWSIIGTLKHRGGVCFIYHEPSCR